MICKKPLSYIVFASLGVAFIGGTMRVRGDDKKYVPLAASISYDKEIRPLLDKYCDSCHGAKKQSGDMNLAGFDTADFA